MTPAHPEDAAEAKAPTPPPLPPRKKRDRDADSGKEDQASTDATAAPKKARASDDAGEADAPKSPSFASFVAHKDTQKADADAQDAAVQADTEKVQDTATTSSTDEVPATVPAPVAATANEVAPERPPEASGDAPGKSGSSARTSVPVVAPTPAPAASGPAPVVVPDLLMRRAPDGGWLLELNPETMPRVLVNRGFHARAQLGARSRRVRPKRRVSAP